MADLAIKPNTQLDLLNTTIDQPLVTGEPTYHSITESVSRVVEDPPTKFWFGLIAVTASILLMLQVMLGYLVATGIGVWGNNIPVGWGMFMIHPLRHDGLTNVNGTVVYPPTFAE